MPRYADQETQIARKRLLSCIIPGSCKNIRFALGRPAPVTLHIYDVLGREVASLAEGQWKPEGPHAVRWDGRDAAGRAVVPGAYYYVLDAGNHRAVKGMIRGW